LLRLQRAGVCLFLVISAGSARAQEQTILNGTWLFSSVTFNGKVSVDGHTSLSFSGNKYEQALDGAANEHGIIHLDQTKTPMTIDFFVSDGDAANSLQLGIIEVTGDTLKLHLNLGTTVRPVNFDPAPENLLIIAKRN
jgi:uncharacterized protein (TIGR03067 family)